MKKLFTAFALTLTLNATPTNALCVLGCGGGGEALEATQLLNLAELTLQTLTVIEKLENVRDLGDVLEVIDMEQLRAIKAYAPAEFQEILAALESIQGANFERIMEVFEGTELVFSHDPHTDTIYRHIVEDAATQAGYAEASYNAATENIEAIYSTRDAVSGLEKQIDRDVAGAALEAETAAGIQEIRKLNAVMANTQAQETVHKALLQAQHVKDYQVECETALCEEIRAMAAGGE